MARQLLLFSTVYLCLKLPNVKATGVFFEEDETFGSKERSSSMAPLFHKAFHQCGIDQSCKFVVQNKLTKIFIKVSKEEDLPLDKNNFRVWYKKKVKPLKLTNIALGKTSSQSSIHYYDSKYFSSTYANDGNRGGDYPVCAITTETPSPWWLVDLGDVAIIERIAVKSGSTWGKTRINPFDIRVGNDNRNGGINNPFCAASVTLPAGEMKTFTCPTTMMGRYVSIHINRRDYLQLCEVEVYGLYE